MLALFTVDAAIKLQQGASKVQVAGTFFFMSEGVVRLDTYTSTLPFNEQTLLPSLYVSPQEEATSLEAEC